MPVPNLQYGDRVLESCLAPGTGPVKLLGAQSGPYESFNFVGDGNTIDIEIVDQDGVNWEVQRESVFTLASRTLSRSDANVVNGSNGPGVRANFSAGVQDVYCNLNSLRMYGRPSGQVAPTIVPSFPLSFVIGQLTAVPVIVAGSGAVPTGTVTLIDGAMAIASAPLVAGSAIFAVVLTVPGSHSLTIVYSGDVNYSAQTSVAVILQAVAQSFSDTFTRPGGAAASLGPNWTVYNNSFGSPSEDTWAISGNQAQASALAGGGTQGIVVPTGVTFADMTVQADMTLGAVLSSSGGGVGIRQDAADDAIYCAVVLQVSSLREVTLAIKRAAVISGIPTHSAKFITKTSNDLYTIRLMVVGTQLFMFVNGVLIDAGSDASLSAPGNGGIIDKGGVSEFANFSLTAGLAFTDTFLRNASPPLTSLTPGYSEDLGSGFAINASSQATPASGYSSGLCVASLSGINVGTVDVKAVIASEGTGSAGVVAQWSQITTSGYAVMLGANAITIYNVVSGIFSAAIATFPATALGSADILEVQAVGSVLTIFLNGVFVGSYVDPNGRYTRGSAGIAADNGGVEFTSFSLTC